MRDLVTRAIQDRSKLIGHALAPVLRTLEPGADGLLNAELAKFASDGTVLRLMVQPASPTGEVQPDSGFFFVASAPRFGRRGAPELDEPARRGILARLSDACMGDAWSCATAAQRHGRAPDLDHPDQDGAAAGADLDPHHLGIPQHVDRPALLGDARGACCGGDLPGAGRTGRAGSGQHLAQPAPLPRCRQRDRPGPHRRLCVLAAQHRSRAVERGARFRQTGDRPQAVVPADPPVSRGQCPLLQVAAGRDPVLAGAGAQVGAARGPARSRRALEIIDPRSPACSPWSTPRSASTTAPPT